VRNQHSDDISGIAVSISVLLTAGILGRLGTPLLEGSLVFLSVAEFGREPFRKEALPVETMRSWQAFRCKNCKGDGMEYVHSEDRRTSRLERFCTDGD
jgi:hypothetical protein